MNTAEFSIDDIADAPIDGDAPPSQGQDQLAFRLVADISVPASAAPAANEGEDDPSATEGGGNNYITDIREATKFVLVAGDSPGYATIEIPMLSFGPGQWDESAFSLALQNNAALAPRARCTILYLANNQSIPVFTGTVTQINHILGNDSLLLTVFDDKFLLSKVTCFGRMVFDPNWNVSYFDGAAPLIFNMDGHPDCIDAVIEGQPGTRPRFSPAYRFGYASAFNTEDTDEPDPGNATSRARTWRVADAIAYLQDAHYCRDGVKRTSYFSDYGNAFIDSHIIWSSGISDSFAGFTRPLKHHVCENKTLLSVLSSLAKKAGPYELNMHVGGATEDISGGTSELEFADMNPHENQGQIINMPDVFDSISAGMTNSTIIHGGSISESIINYFDEVVILGDPPKVEKFITAQVDASNGLPSIHQDDVTIGLQFNWNALDFGVFKNLVDQNGNNKLGFQMASSILPNVFSSYRLTPFFDLFEGTKWDANHLGPAYFRLCQYLLTQFNDTVRSTIDPRSSNPRETVIEYFPYNGFQWLRATRQDDFKLSEDRQFLRLDTLRDMDTPQTWSNSDVNLYNGLTIVPHEIRICIAAEAFWRITGLTRADPNNTSKRVANNSDYPWTFLAVGAPGDYQEWLRRGSKPVGKTGLPDDVNADAWPDKCIEGDELYTDALNQGEPVSGEITQSTDRISNHAAQRLRDVKRIEYIGQLSFHGFNPALRPGSVVNIAGNNDIIDVSAVVKQISYSASEQKMVVDFGQRDVGNVYDIPPEHPTHWL